MSPSRSVLLCCLHLERGQHRPQQSDEAAAEPTICGFDLRLP